MSDYRTFYQIVSLFGFFPFTKSYMCLHVRFSETHTLSHVHKHTDTDTHKVRDSLIRCICIWRQLPEATVIFKGFPFSLSTVLSLKSVANG